MNRIPFYVAMVLVSLRPAWAKTAVVHRVPVATPDPAVAQDGKAKVDVFAVVLSDYLESIKQPQIGISFTYDSQCQEWGGIEKLVIDAYAEQEKAMEVDVGKFINSGGSSKIPPELVPQVTIGGPAYVAKLQAKKLPQGKFVTTLTFTKDGKPAALPINIQTKKFPVTQMLLYGVKVDGQGLNNSAPAIKVSANCDLYRLAVNLDATGDLMDWKKNQCEYTLVFNRQTKKYDAKFTYDSNVSLAGTPNPPSPSTLP